MTDPEAAADHRRWLDSEYEGPPLLSEITSPDSPDDQSTQETR